MYQSHSTCAFPCKGSTPKNDRTSRKVLCDKVSDVRYFVDLVVFNMGRLEFANIMLTDSSPANIQEMARKRPFIPYLLDVTISSPAGSHAVLDMVFQHPRVDSWIKASADGLFA